MKRVYVNEEWCLGCHLCEYHCAFANSDGDDMARTLQGKRINPRIRVEDGEGIHFAVNCRHCLVPYCVKGCLTGALSITDGVISVDEDKCIGCFTCIAGCPYGCITSAGTGIIQKCELCTNNSAGEPQCVKGCPNGAIVFEEREV